jgi:hypothetical protein
VVREGKGAADGPKSSLRRSAMGEPKTAPPGSHAADGADDVVAFGAFEQVAAGAGAHGGED